MSRKTQKTNALLCSALLCSALAGLAGCSVEEVAPTASGVTQASDSDEEASWASTGEYPQFRSSATAITTTSLGSGEYEITVTPGTAVNLGIAVYSSTLQDPILVLKSDVPPPSSVAFPTPGADMAEVEGTFDRSFTARVGGFSAGIGTVTYTFWSEDTDGVVYTGDANDEALLARDLLDGDPVLVSPSGPPVDTCCKCDGSSCGCIDDDCSTPLCNCVACSMSCLTN